MKIKNLLLAGLVLVGMSACSDNSTEFINDGAEPAYDTYLTVNLSGASAMATRAETGTEVGSAVGQDVKNAHIYLVQNGIVKFAHETKIDGLTAKEIAVPAGSYNLFVVANPSTDTLAVNKPIQYVIKDVTEEDAKAGFKKGNFLMATENTSVGEIKNAGPIVNITAANDKTHPAKANAKVDRVAAMIADKTGELTIDGDLKAIKDNDGNVFFTSITSEGFALVNGNTKINQFQEWKDIKGVTGVTGVLGNTPNTGFYNPFSTYATVKMDKENVTEITDLTKDAKDIFSKESVFTVENVPALQLVKDKLTSGMAETTGMIYKTKVNDGDTFYYVAGVIYTDTAEVQKLDIFKNDTLSNLTVPELRAKGIRVYENGIMYFTYFIKDQNHKLNDGKADELYYSVYRNSVYNVKVNNIKNIGDDVPGGGKVTPNNPNPVIDPEEMFMDVTITVNPWVLNNIEIDF